MATDIAFVCIVMLVSAALPTGVVRGFGLSEGFLDLPNATRGGGLAMVVATAGASACLLSSWPAPGGVWVRGVRQHRAKESLSFLRSIDEAVRSKLDVRLVMDQLWHA